MPATHGLSGRIGWFVVGLAAVAACARATTPPGMATADTGWVATWAPSQQLTEPHNMPPAPGLRGSTLRQVLRATLGGTRLRIRISNVFGDMPVAISSVYIARPAGPGAVDPATDRAVAFGGGSGVTIPAGQAVISDPIDYELAPLSDLVVTMHIEEVPDRVTGHPGSRATSYLQAGTHVNDAVLQAASTTEHWYLLAAVDVWRDDGAGILVALGNSITDGRGSGTDRNTRWTDYLAARLDSAGTNIGVVNAGLGGNAMIRGGLGPPALERLDRDVLDVPGARWVIVLIGVNDIGNSEGSAAGVAEELIAGYEEIIARVRVRGLRVYGATILPFGGSQYDSPEHEEMRTRVNDWMRTAAPFDALIDLDAVMRDAGNPSRLSPAFDTGDHLHPNEAGYRALADAVDTDLFVRQ